MPNLAAPGLSLSAAASWGAADYSGGLAAKRADAFGSVMVAHVTGLLFMLVLALLVHEPIPDRAALLWGALAGVLGGIGLACLYKALAIGTMGINAPLSAVITALLPLLFSFLNEGLPHAWQLAGFAVALVSIWLIAAQPGARGRNRGVGLAVIAGIGFSGFLLFSKFAAAHAVFWPLVSARGASALLMMTIVSIRGRGWKPAAGAVPYMVVAGLLDSGANALYVAATQRGRLDVAAVLASLYPASTVILARIFLKERLSRSQTLGMLAALVAVALIAAR